MADAAETDADGGIGADPGRSERPVPDFVLIGAMKAGSTTLFRRLEEHPGVAAGGAKEPNFFSREENYAKGPRVVPQRSGRRLDGLRGEASVDCGPRPHAAGDEAAASYEPRCSPPSRGTPPDRASSIALPGARPAIVGAAATRQAVLEPDSAYVRRSMYSRTLAAVDEVFDRSHCWCC